MSHPTSFSTLAPPGTGTTAVETFMSPVRNRYFYGKLLDQLHLDMEQHYFNGKRSLINRHAIGSGVMCGLTIIAAPDNTHVFVNPGVAIDPHGREIIVPQRTAAIDPRQLTDPKGKPQGPMLDGKASVLIAIGFHECDIEPVASLACECDGDGCQYGAVRERYFITVSSGGAGRQGDVAVKVCDALFAPGGAANRGALIVERRLKIIALLRACRPASTPALVPLALINIAADGTIASIDYSVRTPIVSNTTLLELILCLASELDQCCGGEMTHTLTLSEVSGDNQVANAGALAREPLVVMVDRDGAPSPNETVTWKVGPSGGGVSDGGSAEAASVTTQTAADGTATLSHWRMPAQGGAATVVASVTGATPASVTFQCKVEGTGQPPHIVAIWPPNGMRLDRSDPSLKAIVAKWARTPFVEITFDRPMNQADLQRLTTDPAAWFHCATVIVSSAGRTLQATIKAIALKFLGPAAHPVSGHAGSTYRFGLQEYQVPAAPTRSMVSAMSAAGIDVPSMASPLVFLVRAENGNIRDAASGTLCDAEFDGGILAPAVDPQNPHSPYFDAIFDPSTIAAADLTPMGLTLLMKVVQTAATAPQLTQSGDGQPGGRFHSFAIVGSA